MSTALEGLLRAQRDLVAAASHDLRTPLTNLRAAAEALEDGVGDPAQHLASLQVQVERMTLLVDDLLDLSRFDAGVVPLDVAEIALEPLLDDCLALYAADARSAQVSLERECPPGLRGRCDPLQLGRVLSNLVGNAIRHTPPGGRVVISARDGVEVSVSDTGDGPAARRRGAGLRALLARRREPRGRRHRPRPRDRARDRGAARRHDPRRRRARRRRVFHVHTALSAG